MAIEFLFSRKEQRMNEAVQAEFIVETEGDDWQPQHIHFNGWEDVVFEIEDEAEWPWS